MNNRKKRTLNWAIFHSQNKEGGIVENSLLYTQIFFIFFINFNIRLLLLLLLLFRLFICPPAPIII